MIIMIVVFGKMKGTENERYYDLWEIIGAVNESGFLQLNWFCALCRWSAIQINGMYLLSTEL